MSERAPSLWRERLSSLLTWHYVGFAVLLALAIGLSVRLALDYAAIDRQAGQELETKHVRLTALELQTAPLRGLDQRAGEARDQLKSFYEKRIPPNYSSISSRIGDLAVKSGVRLSRDQYTQAKPGSELTEITIDAGISGEYPQIMKFINSLERDPMFFVVRTMALTGQQGGLVNLRLRFSTWMRPADAAASGLPATPDRPAPDSTQEVQ